MTEFDLPSPPDPARPDPSAKTASHIHGASLCEFDSFEYDSTTDTYRASYDSRVTSPSTAVWNAVAFASETDPLAMEQLQTKVDPDSLDELVSGDKPTDGNPRITFEFQGCTVNASSSGDLEVKPPQPTNSSSDRHD